MRIKLKTQHGAYPPGSIHEVVEVIPHGGHSDDARQFLIADQTYVLERNAEVVPEKKRGRKPATGCFETRAELCAAIWDDYDFGTAELSAVARRYRVSPAVANKIINTHEGRPDRIGYVSTVINVPNSTRSVTVLRKPEQLGYR
jgi:hypothetical protein